MPTLSEAIAPATAAQLAAAAARMLSAKSERDVFLHFGEACAAILGPVTLDAYSVTGSGRSLRPVLVSEPDALLAACQEVETWLLRGGPPPGTGRRLAPDRSVAFTRLESGGLVLGGVVVRAHGPEAATADWCGTLAPLATEALAGLAERRLSRLVLEALEQSEEAISFYDEHDGIIFSNDAYHRVFTHYPDRNRLLGATYLDLTRFDLEAGIIDDPQALEDPEAYLAGRVERSRALVGAQREIQQLGGRTYIYTRTRSDTGATMSRRIDVTEQALVEARLRERERALHILAFRDPLTGLRNRAFLRDRLADLRSRLADGRADGLAMFLIDLDGFKSVNDTYGHACGDELLRVVAERLAAGVPTDDVVTRLGGDEFVVLCERALDDAALGQAAERMIDALSAAIRVGDLVLRIGASVGIATRRGPDGDPATALADADLAMYEAKKCGAGTWRLFDPSMREATARRLQLVEDVRKAVASRAFELHYQPQFDTRSGRLVGFEALMRWRHPERGWVAPDEFIPIIEEQGLIEAVGEWVLRTACREAVRWPREVRLAVNVSPLQVRQPGFSLSVAQTLLRTGLAPERLEFEITETAFLDDAPTARAHLEQWKALGMRIALDDFGHGYSCLSYLGAFPLDTIKIDRGFLAKLDPSRPGDQAGVILRAIIELGARLGMTIVAEGVETPEQLDYLRRNRCTQVQGFLLGRPMPPEAALSLALDQRFARAS